MKEIEAKVRSLYSFMAQTSSNNIVVRHRQNHPNHVHVLHLSDRKFYSSTSNSLFFNINTLNIASDTNDIMNNI